MSGFELNKIFAAVLVAGITAMLSGFIAGKVVHSEELKQDAVPVDGAPVAGAGPKKEKKAEPILALIATADIARGEKLSKACAACHSFDNGGANKVGPNLWGVVGGAKAAKAGFSYSSAMAASGGKWDYVEMNKFMWKPKKHVPGTKMNYNGIKKPADRAALIAWLRTLSGSPAALPSAAQIAAEVAELAPAVEAEGAAAAVPAAH
ncbi:MAG: c-type cytochrome [Alphaproteobacteria bacterium]